MKISESKTTSRTLILTDPLLPLISISIQDEKTATIQIDRFFSQETIKSADELLQQFQDAIQELRSKL